MKIPMLSFSPEYHALLDSGDFCGYWIAQSIPALRGDSSIWVKLCLEEAARIESEAGKIVYLDPKPN